MPQNAHLEIIEAEANKIPHDHSEAGPDLHVLRSSAMELARTLKEEPEVRSSHLLRDRCRALNRTLKPILSALHGPLPEASVSEDFRWLHDNLRLLRTALQDTVNTLKPLAKTPHVRVTEGAIVPRVVVIAEDLLGAAKYQFLEQGFTTYIEAFQQHTALRMGELWALVPAMKLVLLERLVVRASWVLANPTEICGAGICIQSLNEIGQTTWKEVIEPQIIFDRILRKDPAGAYAAMDFNSRDLYRSIVVNIADYSALTEIAVAEEALALARDARHQKHSDPRLALRRSHIGYYLVAEGIVVLQGRAGFRPPFGQRVQSLLRRRPDQFYLTTIAGLMLALVIGTMLPLRDHYASLGAILFSMALLLLPCSQTAVELVNYLTMSLLTPQILPKLDFSENVPADCVTMVAVPSLLLNEKQVCRLVDDLEIRYLGNHDANIHFALLTDLPDTQESSLEDADPLVNFCAELILALNRKYSGQDAGAFFLFHRHRVYNPREGVWMGWERKRGKLLDLNKLLRQEYDSFPVKIGDLSVLPRVRFVITLDSDTKLPRGSAQRMVGTMAHPLNQAIIDPHDNIVVAGYGILQPRVGVSVQSAARSRLASIYSGETGLDIYTRAVSDVYQDLYGEAIFTGKGIYEVDSLHQVLNGRFPRNALLSHDLIEGAYGRAGLATDIEVIDDYPSHYSAYNRRKHRWVRGDWQITEWICSLWVPNESGHRVINPISIISEWRIIDNLRRSLVEPATFFLLVIGWLVLPQGPGYWALATIVILFIPAWCQVVFSLLRAIVSRNFAMARDAASALFAANINLLLIFTFLPHQTLLSLDAIVRTLVRRKVTRKRLLEWETAAEAELETRRTPIDIYLQWTPALALGLGLLMLLVRRQALLVALPVLLLWASSKMISQWLNRPPRTASTEALKADVLLLRGAALRTWRYFADFSTAEHHWLIPDNVQESPASVAARISPTNLGFLLNARQVALEFGYLTLSEFAQQTSQTLATVSRLPRHRGHLFNWYDTRSLTPLAPLFVSTVDSGNLIASLWTLRQGTLEKLRQPVLQPSSAEGLLDYLRALAEEAALPDELLSTQQALTSLESSAGKSGDPWLQPMLTLAQPAALERLRQATQETGSSTDAKWLLEHLYARLVHIEHVVRCYTPWLLPQFAILRKDPALVSPAVGEASHAAWYGGALEDLPDFIDNLHARLQAAASLETDPATHRLQRSLQELLPEARSRAATLIQDLKKIAYAAHASAEEMDFSFLLNRRRKLLSIGFDQESQRLHRACYDLLASESRIGVFAAIAKEDIPQESWFRLGRAHTLDQGRPVLLSWTGTMFEYLMPGLWMRTYSNTLLERSRAAAVRSQQAFTAGKRIPWGISESACFHSDAAGNYQYHAFGLAHLSLHAEDELQPIVISPYSSFLALDTDAASALRNIRRMQKEEWCGVYGFYEAADFGLDPGRSYDLVRCWMAHHQGMTLLAIANFLQEGVVRRWFHSDPRVQATELLLHEKPLRYLRMSERHESKSAGRPSAVRKLFARNDRPSAPQVREPVIQDTAGVAS